MEDKKYTIAAFDFDGTITTKDTLFDFIRFYYGKRTLITGLCLLSPVLIGYKLGFLANSVAKEKLFSHFFKGQCIDEYNRICANYAKRIHQICKSETLDKIKWHKEQNHRLLIVSASNKNWIAPWALQNLFDEVIGTEIEVVNGQITGEFTSKNCYGAEKTNRLLALYPNRKEYTLYAYGDSSGDKELLALADFPTLVK